MSTDLSFDSHSFHLMLGVDGFPPHLPCAFEELAKAAGTGVKIFAETVTKYNEDIEGEGYDAALSRLA
jgi:hypothetical protein